MPFFHENPLEKLVMQPGDADSTVDLQGLDNDQAMQRVEQLLKTGSSGATFLIRFDPAAEGGGETLFLPLGRRLLEARRAGLLARCLPASDGAAYFIAFAG